MYLLSYGKPFEKQIKIIEDQGRKQVEALKVLKPEKNWQGLKSIEWIFQKYIMNIDIKNELDEILKKWKCNS